MTLTVPPSLKNVKGYIKRAEELDTDTQNPDSKVIAYFCRSYAIDKAMGLRSSANATEVNTFLFCLMDILEKEKAELGTRASKDQGEMICENFSLTVFQQADNEDRAGLATKNTAKNFYAASLFFDILEQFGELSSEIVEKRKYAKWKSVDIVKAINEGRQPAAGSPEDNPGGEGAGVHTESLPAASSPSSPSSSSITAPYDSTVSPAAPSPSPSPCVPGLPPAPLTPPLQPPPAPPMTALSSLSQYPPLSLSLASTPPPLYPGPPPQSSQNPSISSQYTPSPSITPSPPYQQQQQYTPPVRPIPPSSSFAVSGSGSSSIRSASDPRCKDAQEYCHYAIAALKVGDINLARERLHAALQQLG